MWRDITYITKIKMYCSDFFPFTVHFKQLSDRSWMIYLWQHQAAYSLMIPLFLRCSGLFFSIYLNFLEVISGIIPLLKRYVNTFAVGLNFNDLCKYIKSIYHLKSKSLLLHLVALEKVTGFLQELRAIAK